MTCGTWLLLCLTWLVSSNAMLLWNVTSVQATTNPTSFALPQLNLLREATFKASVQMDTVKTNASGTQLVICLVLSELVEVCLLCSVLFLLSLVLQHIVLAE